jgi:hypothetical protein
MKIKNFLYNQEPEETVKLAYAAVSSIASKLKIKLRPQKDFDERMKYALTRARHNRWNTGKPREVYSVRVIISASYSSPWRSAQAEQAQGEHLSYQIGRELTDANAGDLGAVAGLLPYLNSLKIIVSVNDKQAWRRQVKLKPTSKVSDLVK